MLSESAPEDGRKPEQTYEELIKHPDLLNDPPRPPPKHWKAMVDKAIQRKESIIEQRLRDSKANQTCIDQVISHSAFDSLPQTTFFFIWLSLQPVGIPICFSNFFFQTSVLTLTSSLHAIVAQVIFQHGLFQPLSAGIGVGLVSPVIGRCVASWTTRSVTKVDKVAPLYTEWSRCGFTIMRPFHFLI